MKMKLYNNRLNKFDYKGLQDFVLSVQLGKTLSFVKFMVGWGGETLNSSSMTLKRPTYQILASCYGTLLKVFGGGLESEFSVHI